MKRRSFFKAIAAIPFIAQLINEAEAKPVSPIKGVTTYTHSAEVPVPDLNKDEVMLFVDGRLLVRLEGGSVTMEIGRSPIDVSCRDSDGYKTTICGPQFYHLSFRESKIRFVSEELRAMMHGQLQVKFRIGGDVVTADAFLNDLVFEAPFEDRGLSRASGMLSLNGAFNVN